MKFEFKPTSITKQVRRQLNNPNCDPAAFKVKAEGKVIGTVIDDGSAWFYLLNGTVSFGGPQRHAAAEKLHEHAAA